MAEANEARIRRGSRNQYYWCDRRSDLSSGKQGSATRYRVAYYNGNNGGTRSRLPV
jgi:hypothetical protein